MTQRTLDEYYNVGITKNKTVTSGNYDERIRRLLEQILAKSKSTGDISSDKSQESPLYALLGHVISALWRCVDLEKFISNIEDYIKHPHLGNPTMRQTFFKNLAKAIIIHDLGKISLDFQRRLYRPEEIPEELWDLLQESQGVRTYGKHELFSLIWSFALLGNSKEEAMIRTAVLLHHYNEFFSQEEPKITKIIEGDNSNELKYLEFLMSNRGDLEALITTYLGIIKNEFDKVNFIAEATDELMGSMDFSRLELLKEQMETFGINPSREFPIYNPREQEEQKTDVDFLVFLGMLRRCDYSSSGDFPIEVLEDLRIISENLESRIEEKIKEKAGNNFNGLWQEEMLKKHNSDYLAVIAPTGSGKTELAVLWAKNKGKLIYTLPLRVALNDLYRRLSKEYFDDEHVGLLHSTAFMEYIEGAGKEVDVEKKVNSAGLLAMPVMLSTPDQVFLTGLNYYGSDKVVSVYPESAIVVDEVQAYTPEMAAVFLKTLQLIKRAGGKVLVITATLPPHIEHFLRREGFEIVDVLEEARRHGLNVKNLHLKRHLVKLVEGNLFRYTDKGVDFEGIEDVLSAITEFEERGFRSVMVVLNNVKKAIEAYKSISGRVEGWEVYLLHSRLPEKKKAEVVLEVKSNLEEGKRVVLIATQVVEASVDIDFDAMITEISPIDSQVQRWGRVYRNRETDYEGDVPNIVVFLGGNKIDQGTINVYGNRIGKDVLEKTKEVLKKLDGKLLGYIEERDAIEEVYSGEILEKYISQINEIYKKLGYFTLEKKSEAQRVFRQMAGMYFVVPSLMKMFGDETAKKFDEFLSEPENRRLSWKDVVIKVYGLEEEPPQEKEKKKEWEKRLKRGKLELRKILQEFSVNIPIWFVFKDRNLQHALYNTFKGYPVVLSWDTKIVEKLWKYGVDEAIDEDLDVNEDIL